MESKTYRYSEIFYSIQGEGQRTGRPTVWLRLFGCNLSCRGFGQKDPTNPDTYKLPYMDYDVSGIEKITDLPVWEFGCDSSYSWSKKYRHLCPEGTAENIVDKLMSVIPDGVDHELVDICFTGGEPLLGFNQAAILDIIDVLRKRNIFFSYVAFETNGTQVLKEDTRKILEIYGRNTIFSISPKLFTVSGEKSSKAIKIDNTLSYISEWPDTTIQFKFVIGMEDRQWNELQEVVEKIKEYYDYPDIWIMPVGATMEEQEDIAGQVATRALSKGYSVAARVHCYLWGNKIGT